MVIHDAIRQIISQFEARELHAARSGREVMDALAAVVADSRASSLANLASDLEGNIGALLEAMPAYAPPVNAVHRVYSRYEQALQRDETVEELRSAITNSARDYKDWAQQSRSRIASYGASVIPDGATLFTYTLSETVLRALLEARRLGRSFRVLATESRPNNDGLITAKSLAAEGIEVEIGIDGNIGEIVPGADLMLVGAEAILSDGSAVCKVGTYPSAVVAREFRVPVYVLVDSMKLHAASLRGGGLWLDPIRGQDLPRMVPASQLTACGHLFDATPAHLISALITERGLIHPNQVSQWMLEMPVSDAIEGQLKQRRN
jgi:ribose 1,5-bisphosphate isomerase